MRRVVGAVVALVCVGMLSSCSLVPSHPGQIYDDSYQTTDALMQHIADAVKSHDAAALKKLFSPRAREKATDLDSGVKYFLSAFPSGTVTWKSQGNGEAGQNNFSITATELFGHYEISADGKKYEVYFAYFPVNDFHPDEVGIHALGVEPYDADSYTTSGAKKPFPLWASQFEIGGDHSATGSPGVYVPQK